MNQGDYRKSRRTSGNNKNYSSHSVPFDFFENMPQLLSDAVIFIDNGKKVTVVTNYEMNDSKGNKSFVILGILQNQSMESDTVNLIKSVYPLDDIGSRLSKAAQEGKLVVTNKNKAEQMLTTIGVQPAEVSNIISLAKNNLSQTAPIVNKKLSLPETDHKQRQFEIVQETNRMWDDYHTGIRAIDDIRTWEEVP